MQKFQKKPVTIAAVQWDGTAEGATQIIDWILENGGSATYHCSPESVPCLPEEHFIRIETLEGPFNAPRGWWIIRGIKGEFYACDPEVFLASYNLELSIEGCTGTVPCECEACRFSVKNKEFDGALYEGFKIVYSGGPSNEIERG